MRETAPSATRYAANGAYDRALSTIRTNGLDTSVEPKAAPAPASIPGGIPRRAIRSPLSPAAARMIGSAAWRDRRLAERRSNRNSRAAVNVAPFLDTPGASAHACPSPISTASRAVASSWGRSAGRRSAAARTTPATSCAPATPRGDPSRSSIGRSNRKAASPGGMNVSACRRSRRPSISRRTSATSCRSAIKSAPAVPACSATSNDLRVSSSSSAYDHPSSAGTSTRWPDDEMGSSSAGP